MKRRSKPIYDPDRNRKYALYISNRRALKCTTATDNRQHNIKNARFQQKIEDV
ncbi:hypothetical protein QUF80_02185 [Desulfococcaceae bacterium HSG8]|nr:hypothetical protein [Desulfococcaceae bacterium HSG8]